MESYSEAYHSCAKAALENKGKVMVADSIAILDNTSIARSECAKSVAPAKI